MSDERGQRSFAHRRAGQPAELPDEGPLPGFDRATGWLGSAPLTPHGLVGRVVLVSFGTYTCVNWLRTLPYLQAWNRKYAPAGLTVVCVHTPEFGFEADLANVREHVREFDIGFPVAVDSDYGVWDAFDNHYWPAIYLADSTGRIRYHHFGEGEYAMTEMAIQQLLARAGTGGVDPALVAVAAGGLEVAADWQSLRSPETYLGYRQASGFASDDPALYDHPHAYRHRGGLSLNGWDLSGTWTVGADAATLGEAGGRIAFRFHARDVNLVMAPTVSGTSIPFRIYLDGDPADDAHGTDTDGDGRGVLVEPQTYQLVRQGGAIADRLVEVEFLAAGVDAYCFTFG